MRCSPVCGPRAQPSTPRGGRPGEGSRSTAATAGSPARNDRSSPSVWRGQKRREGGPPRGAAAGGRAGGGSALAGRHRGLAGQERPQLAVGRAGAEAAEGLPVAPLGEVGGDESLDGIRDQVGGPPVADRPRRGLVPAAPPA